VLVVSHDRFFLDKIINQVFAFQKDGEIKEFPGNYTEYRNWLDEEESSEKKSNETITLQKSNEHQSLPNKKQNKLSYKEQVELENLEREIAKLEQEKSKLLDELSSGNLDHSLLTEKGKSLKLIEENLDNKSMRWLEIQDKNEN
jgi:ATP-binding cassette subfamily F protein uup